MTDRTRQSAYLAFEQMLKMQIRKVERENDMLCDAQCEFSSSEIWQSLYGDWCATCEVAV